MLLRMRVRRSSSRCSTRLMRSCGSEALGAAAPASPERSAPASPRAREPVADVTLACLAPLAADTGDHAHDGASESRAVLRRSEPCASASREASGRSEGSCAPAGIVMSSHSRCSAARSGTASSSSRSERCAPSNKQARGRSEGDRSWEIVGAQGRSGARLPARPRRA